MTDTPRYPHLDDVAEFTDVATKGSGSFAASYIPWAKVSHYMRKHASGWQPTTQPDPEGNMLHTAPDGTHFLMCGFVHPDLPPTQFVPHAVMDHRMKSMKNPDSRAISDAFVRGMCKAAALLFGIGWQLWSRDDPFERDESPAPPAPVKKKAKPQTAAPKVQPFKLPEDAVEAINRAIDHDAIDSIAKRVFASAFAEEELTIIKSAGAKRRQQFENKQHG